MGVGIKRRKVEGDLRGSIAVTTLPLLKTARARDIIVKELGKVRDEMGFLLLGYVVMPEHVHLLMSEPPQGTPSTVLHKHRMGFATIHKTHPRTYGPGSRKCRVCSNHHGISRKYGLDMCRRCFKQYANDIGFFKLD